MKHRLLLITALLLAVVLGHTTVYAQGTQKVSIENGIVYVNGKQVAAERLPESLRSISKATTLKFWSDDEALIEIHGIVYGIEDGTLVEVDKEILRNGDVKVFFSSDAKDRLIRPYVVTPPRPDFSGIRPEENRRAMEEYVASMQRRAEEFENIRFKIDEMREPEVAELAMQLKLGAENAARMAESFPKIQLETYLADINDVNRALHDQLMREQQMEMESHHLAMRIRDASTRAEQEMLTGQLRNALNEAFKLKQLNRKKEIAELTTKLADLQKNLKERESHRDEIVENRLKELLDQYRW